jgi:hypothetical protein
MLRGTVLVLALSACGDNIPFVIPDAAPDAPPDAPDCPSASQKLCGTTCVEVGDDETNCGDCGVTCRAGQTCMQSCLCPDPFVPATLEASQFDQFMGAGPVTVAISPNFGSAINPVLVGYTAATPLDTDIDLSMVGLGSPPFVATAYNFSLSTMEFDATYVATAGTLRLTKACATEAEGTLTDATFRGVTGGFFDPMIDPQGCTFDVATVAFHMMTTACP